jgi:hypothetical protein
MRTSGCCVQCQLWFVSICNVYQEGRTANITNEGLGLCSGRFEPTKS